MISTNEGKLEVRYDGSDRSVILIFDDLCGDRDTKCVLTDKNLDRLISDLQEAKRRIDEDELFWRRKYNEYNFYSMYEGLNRRYNPYPTHMSYAEAYRKALRDGLIDEETYHVAHHYYGKLWDYVGD